ncbi:hypothetical protein GA0074692_0250 [Micromonospora pallida]|uniref:Uncharacterized protein n=1 Tax=Micromonospora pallida TaxID=145854 RepID=A0A1C6RL30_9ACTN|nr:hypothetical protein [Micromonospora pallida]SCL17773.1 hypothetical protein GA0074692_0250 [Micromonospora pallida]
MTNDGAVPPPGGPGDARVRRALTLAAKDVTVPADLLERARRGGRRRVHRHRVMVGAVAVLALAGTATGVGYANRPGPVVPFATSTVGELLLNQPTRGDLAGDADYLRRAVDVHDATRNDSPLYGLGVTRQPAGAPHVAWASRTPAGPAAVVVQPMRVPKTGARVVLLSFLGTGTDGQPEKVGADYYASGGPDGWQSVAFLVGADRSTLVVLDVGIEVEYSVERTYPADGVTRTDWRPVAFTGGAARIAVPAQRGRHTVAVRERGGGYLGIGNLTDPAAARPEEGWLDWRRPADRDDPASRPALFILDPTAGVPDIVDTRRRLGDVQLGEAEPLTPAETGVDWIAVGHTPTGEELVAGDLRIGGDPVRTLVLLRRPGGETVPVVGPAVDPGATLPVAVRLPNGRGWLVARKDAALAWADAGGQWQPAGRDAALLPDSATRVRVGNTVVDLS